MLAIQVLAVAVLAHAAYSAKEAIKFAKVPRDILVEALFGVALIVLDSIWSLELKPIHQSEINSEYEKNGESPYLILETRPNFQSVQLKRQQYLKWKRSQ